MARILPAVEAAAITNAGERLLFQRLEALPDDYLVLHSFPWLRPERWRARRGHGRPTGQPRHSLAEGEADFVVLHPRLGLLIIEVKGGYPEVHDHQWYYDHRRTEPMRDPFAQAQRNMHALVAEIAERGGVLKGRYNYGFAVAFPMARYEGTLPANARPEILIDAASLGDMEAAVRRAYEAWGAREREADEQQRRAIERAILPRLRLLRAVGPEIESAEATLVQLTDTQSAVAVGLLSQRRVVVNGVAGSGKTLLALELASRRALAGDRVLVTCFNRHLAAWMRERIASDPRLSDAEGEIVAQNFHALAAAMCREADVPFDPSEGQDFWAETAPLRLMQAGDVLGGEGRLQRFDTLIADEGQDFLPLWWEVLEDLAVEGEGCRLAVFQDQAQALFTGRVTPLTGVTTLSLDKNCRNTRWIAGASGQLIEARIMCHRGAPLGERPQLALAKGRAEQRREVDGRVGALLRHHGLSPRQIALIGPTAMASGSLAGAPRIGGAPLTSEAAAWREGAGVLCTTARAFKGLEADVVILYDLDLGRAPPIERDLYVAYTRAKHRLVVFATNKATLRRLKATLDRVEVE